MIRIDSFGRSAAFAAVVALAWIPWMLVTGPLLGGPLARTLYLVAVTALYAGGLASSAPRRASVTVGVACAGLLLGLVARGAPELCLALAAVLGTARSAFLHRAAPARAAVTEAVLLIGGLVFARFLAAGTAQTTALALWGFFLVQSVFFLVGGVEVRAANGRHPDPFEEACARVAEVIERPLG